MQIIPLTNDYAQSFRTILNNQEVDIRVWYQDIGNGWFFSMAFSTGVKIVSGYRINNGSPILKSVLSDFSGEIICTPSGNNFAEPAMENPWGNTHNLIYLTQEEAQEVGIEAI